jgi:magnesium-transporting ATPase (P-type)
MSVVTKVAEDTFQCYVKGSPEIMVGIMEKASIPQDYLKVLSDYASNGFRVLAIGSKRVPSSSYKTITRDEAERGLTFNGFEVFENKLKPETQAAIQELKEAEIGVVMITGDNSLTGSNIGYKCGISFKSKGMIIVDYKDGNFTEENFIFRERDEEHMETKLSLSNKGDNSE